MGNDVTRCGDSDETSRSCGDGYRACIDGPTQSGSACGV